MKTKINWMEAHLTCNPRTYLEAKRSKVKVTRPINAVREGHTKFKLDTQTEHEDLYQWQAP